MRSLLVAGLMLVVGMASAQSVPSDVPKNHWAYPAVENLYRAGILKGYPDGTFKGSRMASRYELSQMLDGAFGDLRVQLSVSTKELEDLRTRLGASSQADVNQFRAQLEAVRAEVADANATRSEMDALMKQFADLARDLQRMRTELNQVRASLPVVTKS